MGFEVQELRGLGLGVVGVKVCMTPPYFLLGKWACGNRIHHVDSSCARFLDTRCTELCHESMLIASDILIQAPPSKQTVP